MQPLTAIARLMATLLPANGFVGSMISWIHMPAMGLVVHTGTNAGSVGTEPKPESLVVIFPSQPATRLGCAIYFRVGEGARDKLDSYGGESFSSVCGRRCLDFGQLRYLVRRRTWRGQGFRRGCFPRRERVRGSRWICGRGRRRICGRGRFCWCRRLDRLWWKQWVGGRCRFGRGGRGWATGRGGCVRRSPIGRI